MKLIKLTCPNCGAQLNVEVKNDMTQCYCQYCGQKILLTPDQDIHFTYRNEADVHNVDAKNDLKRRKWEKKQSDAAYEGKIAIPIAIIVFLIIFFLVYAIGVHERFPICLIYYVTWAAQMFCATRALMICKGETAARFNGEQYALEIVVLLLSPICIYRLR